MPCDVMQMEKVLSALPSAVREPPCAQVQRPQGALCCLHDLRRSRPNLCLLRRDSCACTSACISV